MSEENLQVKVAKISAVQAVIVAIITAIGGLATGYFGRGPVGRESPPQQRYLVIDHIQSDKHSLAVVVINVDGISYTYPSTTLWMEIGGMSRARFPLPPSKDGYRVSFRAFLSDRGPVPTVRTESHPPGERVGQFPVTGLVANLYPAEGSYQPANPLASVTYGIE
jgi:hypothetical protein